MEIDWGGKPNYTSYGCPMANLKGHETHNPNHMNESLLSEVNWGAHDSSVFLFLVNIDYDAKRNESPIQGLWENYNIEHPPFLSLGSNLFLWLLDKLEMMFSTLYQLTQM